MANVQRAGRVGGYEFEKNLRSVSRFLASIVFAGLEDRLEFAMECLITQSEIDKSRSSDLDLLDRVALRHCIDDGLRNLSRVSAERFCELHRHIRGEVAMAGVTRTFDGCADRGYLGRIAELRQCR